MTGLEEEESSRREEEEKKTALPPPRPTLTLPPRTSPFGFMTDVSPGPMTLASNFFSDSPNLSFSELLAGAMASPAAAEIGRSTASTAAARGGRESTDNNGGGAGVSEDKEKEKWELPSPLFSMPPGFLDSPNFFSPAQGPYGISHQQALAQVTAQAAWSHSPKAQVNYPPISSAVTTSTIHPSSSTGRALQQMPTEISDDRYAVDPQADTKPQSTSLSVEKPVNDGYNWRKYGQKQVKGSEFPRSYYKCTHLNCQVKKKVERSWDGQVTEITYKGQHNHDPPLPSRRAKEGGILSDESNGILKTNENVQSGNVIRTDESYQKDRESGHTTMEQLSGSSDSEEVGNAEVVTMKRDEDVPDPKRRNLDAGATKSGTLHKTVTEPRIIVQTQSEVDLLDDGYRWRKYGQKVVKGNPHPRSYYKCTYAGCSVRKHVERASNDARAVITTYEGKHNHEVPVARNSTHSTADAGAAINIMQSKAHNIANNYTLLERTGYRSSDQYPAAVLQMKEEYDVT